MKQSLFLCLVLLELGIVYSEVVFTGHANVDFAPNNPNLDARDLALYFKFNNTAKVTLGKWTKDHGRQSGIDMDAIHALYDDQTDTLYLGIQCSGICGDTDGDGNPSGVDPNAPEGSLGEDSPNLCYTEQFSLMFWLDIPQGFTFIGKTPGYFFPTFVVGVDYPGCLWDEDQGKSDWKAYEWANYKDCLWPIPLETPTPSCVQDNINAVLSPGQSVYTTNDLSVMWTTDPENYNVIPPPYLFTYFPNATNPHIEFSLGEWSKYPQQTFVPSEVGSSMRLGFASSSGSSSDSNGEDSIYSTIWDITWDCNSWPNGDAVFDVCGVCGGDNSSCKDCLGIPNGENVYDECNICSGDNTSCADCFGIPNGGAVIDDCGLCGGDGSSCRCIHYLGYDLEDVDYALLRWTVSANILKIEETLNVLESIKSNLKEYDYKSGDVELSYYIDILHSFCDHCLDTFDYAQLWFAEYLSGACIGLECQTQIELPDDETYHL